MDDDYDDDCPDCDGRGVDKRGQQCSGCYGEGVILTLPIARAKMVP